MKDDILQSDLKPVLTEMNDDIIDINIDLRPACMHDLIGLLDAGYYPPLFDDKRPKYSVFVTFIKNMGFLYDNNSKKYYKIDPYTGLYNVSDESDIRKIIYYLWNWHTKGQINLYFRDTASILDQVRSSCDIDSLAEGRTEFLKTDLGRHYEPSKDAFNIPEDVLIDFPNKHDLIAFKNGLFNTKIKKMLPHCRYIFVPDPFAHEFTLMKENDVNQSSIKEQYLSIFADNETLECYAYWVGSLLFDNKPLPIFLNFVGRGSTGKSLVSSVLCEIIGKGASSVRLSSLMDKHGSAYLDDKILLVAHETYASKVEIESIKEFVAKDTYTSEPKYRDAKERPLNTRFIVCGNRYLDLSGDSGNSIKRRLKIIPFDNFLDMATGSNLYKDLSSKQGKDWLVSYAFYLWIEHYYDTDAIEKLESLRMKNAFNTMIGFNPYTQWLLEFCGTLDAHSIGSILHGKNRKEVYEIYCSYCDELDERPMSKKAWYQQIKLDYNVEYKNGSSYTYFSFEP